MVDTQKSSWGWIKWLIIIAIVVLVVAIGLKRCGGPAPVAAAEISGTVGVFTEKVPASDVTNVSNSLIRLDLKESIASKFNALIEADLVCGLAIVNEAWINLPLGPSLNLKAGRFLLPAGYASQVAIADQKLIQAPEYGNSYDDGITAIGKVGNIHYAAAAVNGDNTNDTYDLTGKLSVDLIPKIGLNAGISHYQGFAEENAKFTSTGLGAVASISGLDLAGEFIQGKDVNNLTNTDIYVQGSWKFKSVEPAARLERIDPDKDITDDESTVKTLGLNFYAFGAKLSVNYVATTLNSNTDEKWLAQLIATF